MYGWCGRVLSIDLEKQHIRTIMPDVGIYRQYIGGRGLAGYYLRAHITRTWDDPGMPLLFFTGPLVNTIAPVPGRMTIMTKSPLTGAICDSSCGGRFGSFLKKAGYDGIIITGKSQCLSGIEIIDGKVRIVDAQHLVQKTVRETADTLMTKGATAIIGPAAENGVRYAGIMIDRDFAAGRGGTGLVAASKNLKYITVKGTGKTPVHTLSLVKKGRADILRLCDASPVLMGELGISKFGTGALYDLMDARSMMPTANFRQTRFKHASVMNAFAYKHKYGYSSKGCKGCHIQCKKQSDDGRAIPEFETMSHFSALIENTDMDAVMEANRICNDMGMDTITAAATIACYMEIHDKHLSPEEVIHLLQKIATGTEEGKSLGEGSASYALTMNKAETSISVKGMELSAYDPRGAYGMALSFALSTRGGCHLRAYPVSHEILRKPVATDRFSFDGKAGIIKNNEDLNAVADALTACKFIFFAASAEEYARVFTGVTGVVMSADDLLEVGERILYNERMMNAALGFSAEDDDLPQRFFQTSPGQSGIDREAFLSSRDDYYKIRGLDKKGRPCEAVGKKLGLLGRMGITKI